MVADRRDMGLAALPEGAYRALVEAAADIVAVFHSDGRIRYVNPATTALLGYQPAEVVGRPVQEFFHPEDRERAAARFARVRDWPDEAARPAVYRLRCRDGGYRHLETLSLNRLGDASIDGIFLIARDVTARRRAEAERLADQERHRLVAEVARIGVWEWNQGTGEFVADEAVRQLVRQHPGQRPCGPGELLQRFHPEDRGSLEDALRAAIAGERACQSFARMPLPDGSLRWLYFYAQRLPGSDGPGPRVVGLVMDVSARKSAEQELARRSELLELASWGAGLGVWTWFPTEGRAIIDARTIELLGLPGAENERPVAACNARVHPDDLVELQRLERETQSGAREHFDYAYRVQRDDEWHWVLDRGRITERDAAGLVVRVSGVTLDLDREKRREHQLDEHRLQLGLALQASQLGLWDYDVGRKALFVDARFTGITGIAAEVALANLNALDERMHEEDRARLRTAVQQCFEGRRDTVGFEGRLLGPDGRLTWIDIQGFVARREADGTPARVVGTVGDVTERRRIEQLTRAGELVAASGSYEYDAQGDRFLWSPGTYRVFEYPEGFVPARHAILELLLPASREKTRAALRALREHGRGFDIEVESFTARGRRIWVRMVGRAESFGARPVHYYGIVQDITQRKRLEAALLESANREQQRLGRELHDGLGQELTGISLLLQGLAGRVRSESPALAPAFDRLGGLLSSTIRSTRLLAHGMAPVSAGRGGLGEALKLLAEQSAAACGIPVTLEFDAGQALPLDVRSGSELYRIAQEALNNAVRHAGATRIVMKLRATDAGVELDVLDDGRGIPDDALQGEGMGLRSMAYRAENLQGTLSLQRRPEGGTRVHARVPAPAG